MRKLVESVDSLRSAQPPNLRLTGDDIRVLKRLSDPLESETEFIQLDDIPLDRQFRKGCDAILEGAPRSHGQAIGRLEGMNTHRGMYFRLYPFGMDRGAECYFTEEQFRTVMDCMRKRVRVEGLIQRDPDGVGIDRISQITVIEKLPENAELPTMSSLFGAFKGSSLDVSCGWDD